MRYRSKPTECEAMQWNECNLANKTAERALKIVAWVNDNGGEARYLRARSSEFGVAGFDHRPARIAVRTGDGWVCAAPGNWIVRTDEWFKADSAVAYHDTHQVRAFRVEER